jgi:signal transduction histidine kinase
MVLNRFWGGLRLSRMLSRGTPYLALFSLLLVVVGLVLSTRHFQSETVAIYRQRAAITGNIERIRFYDEALTNSARLAAATGDRTYEGRYRRLAPQLDQLIGETVALVGTRDAAAKIAQTDAANRALVAMELRSFVLNRQQRRSEAIALLTGKEYQRQKLRYGSGADDAFASFVGTSDRRTRLVNRNRQIALVLGIVSGIVVLVIGSLYVVRGREREQVAAEDARRLREHDRLKDSLIASVSHELRTPLTSIRGYLELVLEEESGELTDEQRAHLAIVERNARRLQLVVGDLLFVAQVDAGMLAIERAPVDLVALAGDCVEAARPFALEKGVALSLSADSGPELSADAARLGQVLDNLVSNALKFTPAGGRVEVRTSASDGHAVFEVADTGSGIPAGDLKRVFERFFRTAGANAQAVQGTGLGLGITKAIVEAHGGTIGVESEEGAGTTFRVELPLAGEIESAGTPLEPSPISSLARN